MSVNSNVLSDKQSEESSGSHNVNGSGINVGSLERLACAIAGGALAVYGLRRRSVSGLGITLAGAALLHRGAAGHCNTYQLLGISTAKHRTHNDVTRDVVAHDIHLEKSIIINKSPEELYSFWRQFENLPRFMDHLESVNSVGFNRWHWVAKGPAGMRLEWDAEIYNEKPNELIAWRSLDGNFTNAGSVRFEPAPDGRGTLVKVVMNYNAPGGRVSALLAKMLGQEPGQVIEEDLRRLKQILETGEIATTEGQLVRHAVKVSKDNASADQPAASMMPESKVGESRAASVR
jgi:uncharacterized membrane protein